MSKKIDDKTITTLKSATINPEEHSLTITEQLDRKEYLKIDEVLQSIRGKWDKSKKRHLFPFDPTGPLEELLEKKEMEPKNATAYFPTPTKAIELMYEMVDPIMFEYATPARPVRVLEPSAGIGGIADYLMQKTEHIDIDTVEIYPPNQKILKSKGYNPYCMDFLDFEVPVEDDLYDYIFMNPPFSLKGDKLAYITHINHALKMLKPCGELVAIVPVGWCKNESKKEELFRSLVASNGLLIETLEGGTFKDSGTMIETKVVTLQKNPWKNRRINGYDSYYVWEFMLYASQEQKHNDRYQRLIVRDDVAAADFKSFAKDLIRDYAQRDVYLSSEYIDDYVKEMMGRTKAAELEERKQWVSKWHSFFHSLRFMLTEEGQGITRAPLVRTEDISPGFVAYYNDEASAVEVPKKRKVVPQDIQKEILLSGGDLFDLMIA